MEPGPAVPAGWQLRLLGGFELSDGFRRHTRLPSRPMVALLARLALAPGRSHPREELVEALWPGVAPAVSRNRLRQTLSVLRSVLEPEGAGHLPVLQADRQALVLMPGRVDCDVHRFEQAVRSGRTDLARALYRGELLPGFFDEWVLDERQRLEAVLGRLPDPPAAPVSIAPRPSLGALPLYLSRHFLPEAERQRFRQELATHRLLTLLGPGGAGKTRLAVELARAEQVDTPGLEVAFVSLAACDSRAQALDAIAAALGAGHAAPGVRAPADTDRLIRALQGRAVRLVLDNVEHLVDSTADVVALLTAALPDLRVLVTSRRALDLEGERTLPVPALPLPDVSRPLDLDTALANPAIAMWVDRARQVRPGADLQAHQIVEVAALVHALEGLPLAIELAASRARSLSPGRIVALLAEGDAPRLALLARSGAERGGPDARHGSMERVIAWSWRQLGAEAVRMLHALAVVGGDSTVAAAAAVRGLAPMAAALQLDALVAASMLRTVEGPDGEIRYALYEPIREFALRDLRQGNRAGEEAALRAAHRAWMLEWSESLPSTPSLPAIRAELGNLSTALRSALADGDEATAVRTVVALGRAHDDLVLGTDAVGALARAVARCRDAELRGRGHTQLAQLFFSAGQAEQALHHAACGVGAHPAGRDGQDAGQEGAVRARSLQVQARLHWLLQGYAPWLETTIAEADALARAAQETQVLARLTVLRAAIAYAHRRDLVAGEALYREALSLWERLGNRHTINAGRYFVALVVQQAGRQEEALALVDDVLASTRRLGDFRRTSQALQVQAKALAARRRWAEAAAALHEAIQVAGEAQAQIELARALRDLPRVLAHLRRPHAAVRLQAYAAQAAAAHVGRADHFDQDQERRVRRLVRGAVSAVQWEVLRRDGAALSAREAVALALAESGRPV